MDGELRTRDSGFVGRATLKWVSNDWEGADGNKEGKEKRVYKVAAIILEIKRKKTLTASQTD